MPDNEWEKTKAARKKVGHRPRKLPAEFTGEVVESPLDGEPAEPIAPVAAGKDKTKGSLPKDIFSKVVDVFTRGPFQGGGITEEEQDVKEARLRRDKEKREGLPLGSLEKPAAGSMAGFTGAEDVEGDDTPGGKAFAAGWGQPPVTRTVEMLDDIVAAYKPPASAAPWNARQVLSYAISKRKMKASDVAKFLTDKNYRDEILDQIQTDFGLRGFGLGGRRAFNLGGEGESRGVSGPDRSDLSDEQITALTDEFKGYIPPEEIVAEAALALHGGSAKDMKPEDIGEYTTQQDIARGLASGKITKEQAGPLLKVWRDAHPDEEFDPSLTGFEWNSLIGDYPVVPKKVVPGAAAAAVTPEALDAYGKSLSGLRLDVPTTEQGAQDWYRTVEGLMPPPGVYYNETYPDQMGKPVGAYVGTDGKPVTGELARLLDKYERVKELAEKKRPLVDKILQDAQALRTLQDEINTNILREKAYLADDDLWSASEMEVAKLKLDKQKFSLETQAETNKFIMLLFDNPDAFVMAKRMGILDDLSAKTGLSFDSYMPDRMDRARVIRMLPTEDELAVMSQAQQVSAITELVQLTGWTTDELVGMLKGAQAEAGEWRKTKAWTAEEARKQQEWQAEETRTQTAFGAEEARVGGKFTSEELRIQKGWETKRERAKAEWEAEWGEGGTRKKEWMAEETRKQGGFTAEELRKGTAATAEELRKKTGFEAEEKRSQEGWTAEEMRVQGGFTAAEIRKQAAWEAEEKRIGQTTGLGSPRSGQAQTGMIVRR